MRCFSPGVKRLPSGGAGATLTVKGKLHMQMRLASICLQEEDQARVLDLFCAFVKFGLPPTANPAGLHSEYPPAEPAQRPQAQAHRRP